MSLEERKDYGHPNGRRLLEKELASGWLSREPQFGTLPKARIASDCPAQTDADDPLVAGLLASDFSTGSPELGPFRSSVLEADDPGRASF